MDFFAHQAKAARRTVLLVCIYMASIVVMIPLVYLVLLWVTRVLRSLYHFFKGHTDLRGDFVPLQHPGWWDGPLFFWVAGICGVLIVGGTFYQLWRLMHGGYTLAALLGGVWIEPSTSDPKRRRLLNVVEEMAIASGLPIPDVYLIPGRQGINAFAAGLSSDQAVIGVTEPCLDRLSRCELQGVIAHEFSHLLRGDTQLKTMLIGLMHGLVYVGSASNAICLQAVKGNPLMLMVGIFGLVFLAPLTWPLILVLQLGIGISETVKRLVSRQREYLADAAALQFTRNPTGISGALKKIGGFTAGGYVFGSRTVQMAHLFFAHAKGGELLHVGLYAHPSLTERIRRFEPDFSGDYDCVPYREKQPEAVDRATPGVEPELTTLAGVARMTVMPAAIVSTIGEPQAAHLALATTMLGACPESLAELVRTVTGAQGVVLALLLSQEPTTKGCQLTYLRGSLDQAVMTATLHAQDSEIMPERRLPLAMLAVRCLKKLSKADFARFVEVMDRLIEADSRVDLFEYSLKRMIVRRAGVACGMPHKMPSHRHGNLGAVKDACGDLLSCLAYWGTYALMDQDQAFRLGAAKLDENENWSVPLRAYDECSMALLDQALFRLDACVEPLKKRILDACATCIAADGKTSVAEAEMLQLIADAFDCPLPPIGTVEG